MKFYQNMDPSMRAVQHFEERVVGKGHTSLMNNNNNNNDNNNNNNDNNEKKAHKFAKELGMSLSGSAFNRLAGP